MIDIDVRFLEAITQFWNIRERQLQKQESAGKQDAGTRGAVTGGSQMLALELLIVDIFEFAGLKRIEIYTGQNIELPGYYRPTKKWDLLVVSNSILIAAIEFKSQVGPSFGNNFNNRSEEAIGSANDLWTAYREGRFGNQPRPFLGYFFLLEDCNAVRIPVKNKEPHYTVDPIFNNASYMDRYSILCQRLVLERLYDAVCLTLSSRPPDVLINHPSELISFKRFISELQATVVRFKVS